MFNPRTNFLVGAVACVLLTAMPAHAGETLDFGARVASPEEIVDHLAPVTRPARRRGGVRLLDAQSAPLPMRAISLQVNFAYDSAALNAMAVEQLKPVGAALVSDRLSTLRFDLEGHTDAAGSQTYNLALSERRAAAVKRFFMERFGLDAERLHAVGRGESMLLNQIEPHSGVNRRVTVTAIY